MEQNTQGINTSIHSEYPFSLAKRIFSRVGISLFVMFLVTNVLAIIYGEVCRIFFPQLYTSNEAYTIATMLMQNFGGLLIVALILNSLPTVKPRKQGVSWRSWLGLFAACYALLTVGRQIGNILSFMISEGLGYEIGAFALETMMTLPVWCEILVVVIIAPIGEELIFRKLIIDHTAIFGEKTAIAVSAIIFALFHGNFYQFFYALFIGALLGYIYVKSGNIWLTVSLHAAINFSGSVVAGYMLKIVEEFTAFAMSAIGEMGELLIPEEELMANIPLILKAMGVLAYELLLFGLVIYGWVYIAKRFKTVTFTGGPLQIPKGSGFAVVFGNVGMFLFFLESVFLFVSQMLPAEFWSNL